MKELTEVIGYPYSLALVIVLGAALGSHFNSLAWRVSYFFYGPQRKKLSPSARLRQMLASRSHCPKCRQPIGVLFLAPIIGWLMSLGRCRKCGAGITWWYPLGEITGAAFAVLWYQRLFEAGRPWQWDVLSLTGFFLSLAMVYVITYIDYHHLSIDNLPLIVFFAASILQLYGEYGMSHRVFLQQLWLHLRVTGGVAAFFGLIFILSRYRMGLGDVLLSIPIAFSFGHPWWLYGFNAAFILASGYGVALLVLKHWKRGPYAERNFRGNSILKVKIPLGTFLCGAWIITWIARLAME